MSNIDCFHQAAADILGRLYKEFPSPLRLSPIGLEREAVKDLRFSAECQIPPDRQGVSCFYLHTLRWLVDEGFIRHGAVAMRGAVYDGVILTSKGFAALNRPLEVTAPKETIGAYLGRATETVATSVLSGVIATALNFR